MNINDTTVCINRTVNVNMKAKSISKIMKRIIDILAGIVGMIILIPLMLIIKIANIFTKDSASIFFIQNRIGKDGKIFKMYKFRTMIVGAEEELLIENEEIRNEYELNKKIKDDPRVTKIGKFLRKTSLDEFPQFINILKGEMSLVGPRPYLKREKKDIGQDYYKIIEMTPGLTGLWQVSGRSNITFEERVKLDIEYYKKNSFFGDMKILLKTITAVLNKKGAV